MKQKGRKGRAGQVPDVADRRERLISLCCSLPEVEAEPTGSAHLVFKVRKKVFAYYTFNHHGDGVIALWCKAPPGERDRLVQESPTRYFVPPYLGPKGWVALRLDTARVDWKAARELAMVSYFLTAPESLGRGAGQAGTARPGTSRHRHITR